MAENNLLANPPSTIFFKEAYCVLDFCFVRPDGDLAEHTSFQEKKYFQFIHLFTLFLFVLNDTIFLENTVHPP